MKRLKFPFLLFLHILCSVGGKAQVVNGYAQVSGISGSTITLSNVDEAGDTFEDGEQLIIMQMQDDVIGSNTGDDVNFGDLGSIASAGLYEIVTVSSHVESGGTPTSITLTSSLNNTYNTGSNSLVQIITYPTFGSPDYTTTSAMSAKAWDGNTGGVVAFNVVGTLTIAHNIDANEAGFRGAAGNGGSSAGCTGGSNWRLATTDNFADKGEGIYRVTDTNYAAGKAKILNGGGGANSHNGGGGGGSNFTAGGQGGPGYPNCSPSAGGTGGVALGSLVSSSRIFMGGGGGAGEGNNGGSGNGGNGGGIVLISANSVLTTGSCGGLSVSANGGSVTTGGVQDGNSGGGGGGSVLFNVVSWNIAAGCLLTTEANGGNGGDVVHGNIHGAGGGGGMGAVIFSITEPTTNTTVNTFSGTGGLNCTTCGVADSGTGTPDDGIIDNSSGPLPIELAHFDAYLALDGSSVILEWSTFTEINNQYFTIERSANGYDWEEIERIDGAGNSSQQLHYRTQDNNLILEGYYYRLRQTDFSGSFELFEIHYVAIPTQESVRFAVFPNPTNQLLNIEGPLNQLPITVFNSLGQQMERVQVVQRSEQRSVLDVGQLHPGFYMVVVGDVARKIYKE